MAVIDLLILNVNEIPASVDFYVNVMGFSLEGEDGPFTVSGSAKPSLYCLALGEYGGVNISHSQ